MQSGAGGASEHELPEAAVAVGTHYEKTGAEFQRERLQRLAGRGIAALAAEVDGGNAVIREEPAEAIDAHSFNRLVVVHGQNRHRLRELQNGQRVSHGTGRGTAAVPRRP